MTSRQGCSICLRVRTIITNIYANPDLIQTTMLYLSTNAHKYYNIDTNTNLNRVARRAGRSMERRDARRGQTRRLRRRSCATASALDARRPTRTIRTGSRSCTRSGLNLADSLIFTILRSYYL